MSRFTEADRLLRLIVRERQRCERCGDRGTEVAHIVRRRYTAVRWLEDNVWLLCGRCHLAVDNYMLEHAGLVETTIGPGRLVELMTLAQRGPSMSASAWAASERARLRDRCRGLGVSVKGAA